MGHSAADIDRQVRIYMVVFVALLALSVVTVAASYLDLPFFQTVALALFIATVKGSLVACYFMHMLDEKKLIFWVLGFTVFFFFFLLGMPSWWASDPITN